MKTFDLQDKSGLVTSFEVRSTFLSRYAIPGIVASIPGAKVVRKQARFAAALDDFCVFTVDGAMFEVVEPFGDNSRYWINSIPPEPSEQLNQVRAAFEQHRILFGLFAG